MAGYFLYPLYIHGSCGLGRFVRGRGGGGGGGELDQEKMFRERFEKLMKAWGKDGILFHGSAIIAHDGRSARPRGESQQHSRRWRMILMQAQHGVD